MFFTLDGCSVSTTHICNSDGLAVWNQVSGTSDRSERVIHKQTETPCVCLFGVEVGDTLENDEYENACSGRVSRLQSPQNDEEIPRS